MGGRAFLTMAVLAGGTALLACLSDLAPPATCPPAAAYSACSSSTPPAMACMPSEVLSCLAQQRGSTSCDPTAPCAPGRPVCYPNGDCPPAADRVGSASRACRAIDRSRLSISSADATCVFGCAACVADCDGVGPVMAGPAMPTSPKTTLHADLSGMPPSGRLGVYLRGRGRSGGSLRVNGAKSGTNYALTTALTPDIVELVFYDDAPALPYVWQTQAEAPTSIDVDIDIGPFEIDCIVPIVGVDR